MTKLSFQTKHIFTFVVMLTRKIFIHIWGTEDPLTVVGKPMYPQIQIQIFGWLFDPSFFKNDGAAIVTVNAKCYRAILINWFFSEIDTEDTEWHYVPDSACHNRYSVIVAIAENQKSIEPLFFMAKSNFNIFNGPLFRITLL